MAAAPRQARPRRRACANRRVPLGCSAHVSDANAIIGRAPSRGWSSLARFACVLAAGFALARAMQARGVLALSDDDYARVVLAQRFAASPRLDPSGTSWLPAPFWIAGGAMRIVGASLDDARLVAALVAGLALALLFHAVSRARGALAAAVALAFAISLPPVTTVLPLVVPELATAALATAALVHASRRERGAAALAGALVLVASLSRYEAWPVAFVVALAALVGPASRRERVLAATLALAGPLGWIAWNRLAHGDALHFLARVSAYRAALGGPRAAFATTAGAYLRALASGCPSVAVPLVAALGLAAARARPALVAWRVPAAGAIALVAFLVVGAGLGGAPTHHPERTLLVVWMLAAVATVDLLRAALPARARVVALVVVAASLAPIDRARVEREAGLVDRVAEERVGRALAAHVEPGERVLVATDDYGYFAIEAAFGRVDAVEVDRSHDPREPARPSALASPGELEARMRAARASWLAAPSRPDLCGGSPFCKLR